MAQSMHLIVRVGATWAALPAASIEAVLAYHTITPIPGAHAAIMGLVPIRSRILPLIDCAKIAGEIADTHHLMAVIMVDGHGYGLAIDAVSEVVPLGPAYAAPAPLAPGWATLGAQLIEYGKNTILCVDPAQFIIRATMAAQVNGQLAA
jgi:purine-binding chemotaxis protein CheW